MAVNTIQELIALLNQVDTDATVLAAIANDSATATANGPGPGLVTTRLGSNVRNVQKVISDIENNLLAGIRTNVQKDGAVIVDSPSGINFEGSTVTVTDVDGVATVTMSNDIVTRFGSPTNKQLAVWAGSRVVEGTPKLLWNDFYLEIDGDMLIKNSTTPIITLASIAALNNGNANLQTDANASLILNADTTNVETNSNISLRVDGNTVIQVDTTGAIVTGNITALGRVDGSNFQVIGSGVNVGLYLSIDSLTGLAEPVDPVNGDPFDTIYNALNWIEKNYLHVDYVSLDIPNATYDMSAGFDMPSNIGSIVFSGGTRGSTILDFGTTGSIKSAPWQGITFIDTTIIGAADIEVGGLHVRTSDITTSALRLKVTGSVPYVVGNVIVPSNYAAASLVHNSTFTFTNTFGGAIVVSNCEFIISNSFVIDVSVATNGLGHVVRAENALVYVDADANIDIQDRSGGAPVTGSILITHGASYIQDPAATITIGNVVIADTSIPTLANLRPGIVAVTTSRDLALTDVSDILEVDTTGGAIVLTIPTNASVAFPIGTKIEAVLLNVTNSATLTAAGTVTLNGVAAGSEVIVAAAYSHVTLYKRGTNDWIVYGDVV
jgi:hypothetical protein